MKEVKRIANVGEKIKVVNPFLAHGYSKGDVFTVKSVHPESVIDHSHVLTVEGHVILTPEYVVLEVAPSMVDRLEGVLVVMESQVEAVRNMIVEAKESEQRAKIETVKELMTPKAPKLSRMAIVRKAVRVVNELESVGQSAIKDLPTSSPLNGQYFKVQFNVNESKRTVVAVVKDKGNIIVRTRGVAKCDPSDLFNTQVGKAIALQRALSIPVDPDFLNLPRH